MSVLSMDTITHVLGGATGATTGDHTDAATGAGTTVRTTCSRHGRRTYRVFSGHVGMY